MTTLHAPAAPGARAAHDLWHALLAAPHHHRGSGDRSRISAHRHQMPERHLMTDPDVFDVFGEDDAA